MYYLLCEYPFCIGFDAVFERTYRAGFHQSPKGEKHERKKEEHMK
jgi:hypothetical protein